MSEVVAKMSPYHCGHNGYTCGRWLHKGTRLGAHPARGRSAVTPGPRRTDRNGGPFIEQLDKFQPVIDAKTMKRSIRVLILAGLSLQTGSAQNPTPTVTPSDT